MFVGRAGSAELLGVTRQLLGKPGNPFAYRGSLGPIDVPGPARDDLRAIGEVLAGRIGLVGLFGVDFLLRGDRAAPVEVNPRYSASVEVLELASGRAFLAEHRRAFDPSAPASAGPGRRPSIVGKSILFAPGRSRLPPSDRTRFRGIGTMALPPRADLPPEGSTFEAGEPVLTVLARGASPDSCEARLEARRDRWNSRMIVNA